MTAGASRSSTSSSPTRSTASRSVSAGASQRPLEDLRDVLPAEVLAVLRLRRVVEHDEAVRARRGDGPSPPPPRARQPRPAGPAADPLVPARGHLDGPHARDPPEDVPGLLVHLVVPSQVARVDRKSTRLNSSHSQI